MNPHYVIQHTKRQTYYTALNAQGFACETTNVLQAALYATVALANVALATFPGQTVQQGSWSVQGVTLPI